jgi:hypothetical protein
VIGETKKLIECLSGKTSDRWVQDKGQVKNKNNV